MSSPPPPTAPSRAWIVDVGGAADDRVRVFGLTAGERLRRNLLAAGVASVEALPAEFDLDALADEPCLMFRADCFYDERLVSALALHGEGIVTVALQAGEAPCAVAARATGATARAAAEALRSSPATPEVAGLPQLAPVDVVPAYNKKLRKFDPPFVVRVEASTAREVERRIFRASYKGITDLVTKWVWPLPARLVVAALAKREVTPNQVTYVSYVLTALATWWFAVGWFGAGLVAGWLMTFLDTVDGKLARVTLTSSRLGDVLDHGLDLVHPPIWWFAWAWGIGLADHELAMWVVVGGYFVGRLLEGVFLLAFKQEIFTWRPFDAFFRTIIARRNPNLLLLTAGTLAGRPDLGFSAVAVWTAVCLLVPVVRIVQAFAQQREGVPVRSFHEQAAEAHETAV